MCQVSIHGPRFGQVEESVLSRLILTHSAYSGKSHQLEDFGQNVYEKILKWVVLYQVTTHSCLSSISAYSHHTIARSSTCRYWNLVDFSKITLACSESSRHVITSDCLNTVTVPLAVVHCPLHVLFSVPIMHTPVGV